MFRKIVATVIALVSANFVSANEIADAIRLNDRGFVYLSHFLDKREIHRIYSQDRNFVVDFPFSIYQVVDIPQQGKFYVEFIEDVIKNTLRNRDVWERNIKQIIETYSQAGTLALDIGSHIGTHTITMSKCVGPQGKVIAFEPNKKIYRELCLNLALNRCENVMPLRCALGKEHGEVKVVTPLPNNEGGSYVIDDPGGSDTAAMIRLDDLNLSNVSFIKMDVENMEADVIDGARETINRCRPIMVIEIQGNRERPMQLGEDSQQMAISSINKIQSLGYRLQHLGVDDYLALP